MNTEEVKKNFESLGKDLIITKKENEQFIIDRLDDGINNQKIDPILLNCILPVVNKQETEDGLYLTLEFNDFDGTKKQICVNEIVGEFYTDEVRRRRKKDLAIRNILSLMEYNEVTLEDLQSKNK